MTISARCFSFRHRAHDLLQLSVCLNDRGIPNGLVEVRGDRGVGYVHVDDGMMLCDEEAKASERAEQCADLAREDGFVISEVTSPSKAAAGKYMGIEHTQSPATFPPPGSEDCGVVRVARLPAGMSVG